MEHQEIKSLLQVLQIDLLVVEEYKTWSYNRFPGTELLMSSQVQGALKEIVSKSSCQSPIIYQDEFGVYYVMFFDKNVCYLLGPISLTNFSEDTLKAYFSFYGLPVTEFYTRYFNLEDVLNITGLIVKMITGKFFEKHYLLQKNPHLSGMLGKSLEIPIDNIREEELIQAHHTYQEERRLLEYVKRGAVGEALAYQEAMDKSIGRLSHREVTHWRNLTIVAITLSTRAAIDGGLSPAVAYKISDTYIQQCDNKQTAAQLIAIRNRAVTDLVENVHENQRIQTQSSYVRASTAYIDKHYREKIYLEDVADYVGLSPSYFSKLFKKEVGLSFQNYVTQVRLEYAANLLRYSTESLSAISEYVNFPSQSYFGRYFKSYYHMTPKEYRHLYQVVD
ncbi:helix-turn-helix transcriptional regulator [Streptococcus sp. S784/96/1]|uniref:helix-turn-helix transcriptional regulator n=1 Tax=Streptococcus sp. S784/96/1 TaxID=2653499 RepID=UPI001386C297|nr:AraC family transcriptional regulator [Streptococcus sp. S784/96/1]